ncbi:hypothetical protein Droror1_Dr00018787 [Drosera rotundifolia]
MIAATSNHHRPPSIPSTATAAATADAGVQFRLKLHHIRATLNLDPHLALSRNPNLRAAPLSTIAAAATAIASFGIERAALTRIFDLFPLLLTSDPYLDLYPVFHFLLSDVGVPFHDIRKSIIRCPRLLVCDVEEQLRPALGFLRGLGFVGANRVTCKTTVLLVYNEGTMMRKIEYLMGLGLGYDEVAEMVVRAPGLLMMSVEGNLGKKVEYFREVMMGDLEEIKRFPQYFLCSLEGKIKPRHKMLVEHGFSMSLGKMLKCSDGDFEAHLIKMRLRPADDQRSNKCNSKVLPVGQGLLPEQNEKVKMVSNPLIRLNGQEFLGERSLRSWQPPPFGCVKINVDAAVRVEATFVGCIARNHQGKVLKAYSAKLPAFDALTAEAEGYKAAARWAISMGFEDVIIEGDAKRVVDSYNKGAPARYGWQIATTLQRIQGLSRSLEATEVKFVPRECNSAAHELCQWAARTGNLGHIESYALPHRVRDVIKDELLSISVNTEQSSIM